LTSELVLPFPKPAGRKGRGNAGKKRAAAVLTDTLVKETLRDKQNSLKQATKKKNTSEGKQEAPY
jgi:hypothetical protein